MVFPQAIKQYTVEEYLALERPALEKHEYRNGEISLRPSSNIIHCTIQVNFLCAVATFSKSKSCEVLGSDLRIYIPAKQFITYPDAVIVCGEPKLLDNERDTLLNPAVIVEVLSKSTQSYDRGDKFNLYGAIPSLKEYILIASEAVGVEQYTKQEAGTWLLKEYNQMQDVLPIKTIDFSLPLSELYSGVLF